jgi:hypothetical protein
MEFVDQIDFSEQCAAIFTANSQIEFEKLSDLKDGLLASA